MTARAPWALLAGLGLAVPGLAQQPPVAPDVDAQIRQQRELERQRSLPQPTAPRPATQGEGARVPEGPTLLVKRFVFEGNERYTSEQLAPIVAPYLQRRVTLGELELAAADVARYYRAAGWVARVIVPPQQVDEGTVRLKVIEAVLGQTRFSQGTDTAALPVRPGVIVGSVQSRQAPGAKFNIPAVERGLLLANDLPGIGVAGSQAAGAKEAETDVVLDVSSKGAVFGEASLDNLGARSTGAARATGRIGLNSPAHFGEQLDAIVQVTEYMRYLRVGGSVPLGADGLRLGANAAYLHYRVGADFSALEPRGSSKTLGADLLYPAIRSASHNLYLDAAVEHKRPYNTASTGTISDYSIDNLLFKLDGNAFDQIGGGGISTGNLTFVLGHVKLSDSPAAYVAADAAGPRVAGTFQALRYRFTRMQRLGGDWSLQAGFSGQQADKNLDSAEKLYLGGPYGVRAYPVNEAGGSSGQLLNVDLKWRLPAAAPWGFELSAFYDRGHIRNPYSVPGQLGTYSLSGWGLGLAVDAPYRTRLSAIVARRIGDNPGANAQGRDQDGSLDRTRFWLTGTVSF
ncbi:ShlB/FhaC/HecB family hemolysin secretion/activation protein [Pelomonas sp. KK5]|uniref:ShlB/FhaC/HecB family hemolysin secretion/activation protein n=1 Tax=Pelomonas sp. KK5 TaxID=1855730 RepID=UPI001301DBF6|nr:ShlB/FhaC/HecB family hemolysin secretion/activation protein [Pelomonas sp. KK5]